MSQISTQVETEREVMNEYRAVREGGAGLIDLSQARGRVGVGGSEAVQFLNGLVTNDMKTLAEGSWMAAALPNVQGRLLASVRVIRRAGEFLFDTEAATLEVVLKTLGRFTLAGDFRVTDLTGETATLSVQGARATEMIESLFGKEASSVGRGRVFEMLWQGESLSLIRATHTGEDGFDLFVNASRAEALREALIKEGAQVVGTEALEILRVEAGLPRFGVDVDETNVVLEAGLDEAVSFTKGCYIGQEIIARIHWRGHVAKRLAGLKLDDESASVKKDDRVRTADGKEVGRVTSAVFSPRLNRTVALGIIKYDYLADGAEILVASDASEHRARVSALPLVRGGWFETGAATENER